MQRIRELMKKNPEQTNKTRQQIVDAFWSLYETTSIERITVKEIVAHANCNRSTFYVYFENVYEVLSHIETTVFNEMAKTMESKPKNPSFEDLLKHLLESFETEWKFLSVLLSENGDPAFSQKMRSHFEESFKSHISGKLTKEQANYIAEYTAGGISYTMTKWLKEGRTFPIEELFYITHVFKETEEHLLKGEIPFLV